MVRLDRHNQKSFTLEFSPKKNFVKSATTIFSYNPKDLIRRPLVWLINILPLNHLVADIERIFKMIMIHATPVLSDSRNSKVVPLLARLKLASSLGEGVQKNSACFMIIR